MKMVDIAKKAGVSIATVSRVINNEKSVQEKTRKKVMEIIKEYDYTPSAVGRNLSKKETNIIAVIVPDISNPFFSSIVDGITKKAEENGLGVILFSTGESRKKQSKALNMALEQRVKGIIISVTRDSYEKSSEELEKIQKKGIPLILVDRDIKDSFIDGVFIDNIGGAYKGVEVLAKNGHKRIATITGPMTSKPGRDRLKGYKRALERNKIDLLEDDIYEGDFEMRSGYIIGKKILEKASKPSSIFISNNQMTLGFIKAINEMRLEVPKDIEIVSFDRVELLDIFGIKITTVSVKGIDLGIKAGELLLEKTMKTEKESEMKRLIVSPSIRS